MRKEFQEISVMASEEKSPVWSTNNIELPILYCTALHTNV